MTKWEVTDQCLAFFSSFSGLRIKEIIGPAELSFRWGEAVGRYTANLRLQKVPQGIAVHWTGRGHHSLSGSSGLALGQLSVGGDVWARCDFNIPEGFERVQFDAGSPIFVITWDGHEQVAQTRKAEREVEQ